MWIQKRVPTACKTNNSTSCKRIEITPAYDAILAENQHRLLSDVGVQLRINRSIQVEGTFGVLKQDFGFRRFLHRGTGKVHKNLVPISNGIQSCKTT